MFVPVPVTALGQALPVQGQARLLRSAFGPPPAPETPEAARLARGLQADPGFLSKVDAFLPRTPCRAFRSLGHTPQNNRYRDWKRARMTIGRLSVPWCTGEDRNLNMDLWKTIFRFHVGSFPGCIWNTSPGSPGALRQAAAGGGVPPHGGRPRAARAGRPLGCSDQDT